MGTVQEGGRVEVSGESSPMEEASKNSTEKVRGQMQKPSKASGAQELLGVVLSVNAPYQPQQWL